MCADNSTQKNAPDIEILKLQVDYTWKWFAYHADQRMKALNFMLVALSILSTAIVTAIDKDYHPVAIGLSVAGIAISFSFFLLDRRNQTLIDVSRYALYALETNRLFPEASNGSTAANNQIAHVGIVKLIYPLSPPPTLQSAYNTFSHRQIIPGFMLIFVLIFSAAIFYVVTKPAPDPSSASFDIKLTPKHGISVGSSPKTP